MRILPWLACVACIVHAAESQTLYKWVDKDGKTQFSDKPPVGFKGEVTRIQTDATAEPAPRWTPPPKRAVAEDDKEKGESVAGRRKQLRDQLLARLNVARAKLDAARKALGEGDMATGEEKQFVRQEFERNERRPERTPPPRGNCMSQKTTDGKAVWNCPRSIPTEAFFERQSKLEEAVRAAEVEVEEAERAYRRGVD